VFDPGLGHVRVGFFFSLYDFTATIMDCREFPRDRGAIPSKSRKNKQREKYPAPGAGLIAVGRPESRQSGPETSQI
jgi:hypothetical protein